MALAELTPNCVFETRHEDGDCGEDVEGDEDHEDVQASQITHQFMFTPSPPPARLVLSLHHTRGSVPDTPAILTLHIYLKQIITDQLLPVEYGYLFYATEASDGQQKLPRQMDLILKVR